jgi:3',5'-cyclic AMP phosphodiesterase CpdA
MAAEHTEDELGHATIALPGLAAPLRVLHLTDSHIDRGTDLGYEGSAMNFGQNMHQRYEYVPDPAAAEGGVTPNRGTSFWRLQDTAEEIERNAGGQPTAGSYHEIDNGPGSGQVRPHNVFEAQLHMAQEEEADLVVHTGNLVNFPSFRGIYYVWDALEKCGLPYLYTSGSSDWCWQDMIGTKPVQELQQQYCWEESGECATLFSRASESSLLSTEQYDAKAWSEVVGGVRFVGVDNSTQVVTAEQLTFVQEALAAAAAAAESVVIMVHIPLYTPELRAALDEAGLPPNIDWDSVEVNGALCGDPNASQVRGAV